jgi:hypothetical protein
MLCSGTLGMEVFLARQKKYRLFRAQRLEVVICIHFSEIEEEIITTHDLQRFVVVERMPNIFRNLDGEWDQRDNNIYLGTFLTDTHVETVASLPHAKVFERQFLSALEPVRSYFNNV